MVWSPRQSRMMGTSDGAAATVAIATRRRIVRTQQPQGNARIDWGNPITRGLSFAWGGQKPFAELLSGRPVYYSIGGGVTPGIGLAGKYATSGSSVVTSWAGANFDASTNYTLVAVVLDNAGRGVIRSVFDSDDSGSARVFQFRFTATNTVEFISFSTSATPYFATSSSPASSSTGLTTIAARTNSNVLTAFMNGSVAATGVALGATQTIATPGSKLSIGNFVGSASQPFTGQIYLCLHFARALSDAEIASISANPWQIFEPQLQTVWVPA